MSLIRKHGAVLQAWACLDLVFLVSVIVISFRFSFFFNLRSLISPITVCCLIFIFFPFSSSI